jgi:hypothetical protein
LLANTQKFRVVYAKFFCFKIFTDGNKTKFSFASPLLDEQTQVVPKNGGNMHARAIPYVLGGLIFSGIFFLIVFTSALVCTLLKTTNFFLWGLTVYTAYLFFLNLLPLEYPSGKTDALVYKGIKKGEDTERVMLAAMEIQGQVYAGKTFTEIDEPLYFNLPQLPEDEPLYAVILDLRYRYYLEKGELGRASDCLDRLASAQEYLPANELEKLAAELVYMHSLFANVKAAEENAKVCQAYLKSETATAKRVLAAWSAFNGKTEAVTILKEQAENLLDKELFKGIARWEKILLDRIQTV